MLTPAASANKAVLLYSGLSHQDNYHSVPIHLLSPGHHALDKLDQLALHREILASSNVGVALAPGQVLLVLPHLQGAGLAPPPCGRVLHVPPGASGSSPPRWPWPCRGCQSSRSPSYLDCCCTSYASSCPSSPPSPPSSLPHPTIHRLSSPPCCSRLYLEKCLAESQTLFNQSWFHLSLRQRSKVNVRNQHSD